MVKKNGAFIIISILFLAFLASKAGFFTIVGVGDEGMITYDDFKAGLDLGSCQYLGVNSGVAGYSMRDGTVCEGDKYLFTGTSTASMRLDNTKIRDGTLEIPSSSQSGVHGEANHAPFLIKRDFYANDIKITFKVLGYPNRVLYFYINEKVAYSLDLSTIGSNMLSDVMSFEVRSGDLNPNELVLLLNSEIKSFVNITGQTTTIKWGDKVFSGKMLISMSANNAMFIKKISYKIPFACGIPQNHLLAMETFGSGEELDLYSMRYEVKRFCLDHPVIRTSNKGMGSDATAEPYLQWIKGKKLIVPNSETWTVFYIMDNSNNKILTACNIEESYNVNKDKCEGEIGIVYLCSDGVYNSEIGACVITNINTECTLGRLELVNNTNRCVYNPPVDQLCESGTFNPSTGTCQALNSFDCPNGYDKSVANGQTVCTTTFKEFSTIYLNRTIEVPSYIDRIVEVPSNGKNLNTNIIIITIILAFMLIILFSRRKKNV